MKIAICIPTTGSIKTKTFCCLISLLKETKQEWIVFTQTSAILHESRNILALRAITEKCTHLLFVDTDMEFPIDSLSRLLKREKKIIGVPTNIKQLPLVSTAKKRAEGFDIWENEGDLIKCASVGTGFMLIDLSVFKELSKPYFFYSHLENGKLDYGEDAYFCRKAREAGFPIYLDTTLKVGHIGDYIY